MPSGLRPYRIGPFNRGCAEKVVIEFTDEKGEWIDKTDKVLYLTAKTKPWDEDASDSDAIFKVIGTIEDAEKEPGRVIFYLSETQTYLDPKQLYFCDVVETDNDGTSNAKRVFIGNFNIIGGANNAEAGGQ